ncbi:MAG: response regulator [Thermodesulfobacteriota bacterium]
MQADAAKGSVLLVDDGVDFVRIMAERLRERGYQVAEASDGPTALDALERSRFDTIVLDLVMPGMDGIETLRRIKERDPAARVIVLSGHASGQYVVQALALGALDFMVKPVDIESLLARLEGR